MVFDAIPAVVFSFVIAVIGVYAAFELGVPEKLDPTLRGDRHVREDRARAESVLRLLSYDESGMIPFDTLLFALAVLIIYGAIQLQGWYQLLAIPALLSCATLLDGLLDRLHQRFAGGRLQT
jgi:hypothetical protein